MDEITSRISFLREEIRKHDHLYYIEARPEISDRDYDALYTELKRLEAEHPELVTPDSPTQRVSGAPLESFSTIPHSVPMLSLDNTYNREDLRRFHEYVQKGLHGRTPVYTIEPKIDGVSISLRYEDGVLVQALTRGNGKFGDDVTANIRTIPSVPLRLRAANPPAVFEARGEVYMSRAGFQQLNARRLANGEEEFANARNATAGSIKQLDSRNVANRPLDILFYTLGETAGVEIASQRQLFEKFAEYGLKIQSWLRVAETFDDILKAIAELDEARRNFLYDTDGAVIKVDSFADREILGMTAKAPSWAKAFKFEPERAETKLLGITIQVGRTGVLTPVAELEPVFLSGSTIARATLHNEDEIARKDIRIGDTVVIEKAGEVIPAVIGVVMAKRPADSRPFDFAASLQGKCPSCGEPIVRDPQFAAWRCGNLQCPAQNVRRVEYFAARNALDLESLGGIVAEAMVETHLINEPLDLFGLTQSQVASLNLGTPEEPRIYGPKNAAKLLAALERSRTMPLSNWLQALGIPEVGAATAYQLGQLHDSLEEVADSPWLKKLLNVLAFQSRQPLPYSELLPPAEDTGNSDSRFGELFAQAAAPHAEAIRAAVTAWAEELQQVGLLKHSEDKNKADLLVTTSVGPKTAQAVLDFFAGPIGKGLLARLAELDIHPQGGKATTDKKSPIAGKVFVLTGTLQSMDRDTASAKIRQAGGKTASAVSKNTTYLVAGENTGARKTEKAAELGIQVLNETEFLALLEADTAENTTPPQDNGQLSLPL